MLWMAQWLDVMWWNGKVQRGKVKYGEVLNEMEWEEVKCSEV